MSGGNRGINLRSEREVRNLIRSLEDQGARAESSGNGFPIKVYPPDPTKHFILFHGSVSDRNAATMTRNEVRRAGLRWPGDDGISAKQLRKAASTGMIDTTTEDTMTMNTMTSDRKTGEHLVVPPGAVNFNQPSITTRARVAPLMESLPETFWTAHAVAMVRAMNIPGYNSPSATQRMQGLLDYFGFRVVETKPNRAGTAYRWVHEVPARTDVSERIFKLVKEQPVESPEPVAAAPKPLPATAGPIAAAMAAAEAKRAEKAKHERAMCPVCLRHFTPEGLAKHVEETQHGLEASPEETAPAEVQAEATADEQPADAIEALRGGPVDLEVEEWRALITEAEAETARVREQLAEMIEHRDDWHDRSHKQAARLQELLVELNAERAKNENLEDLRKRYADEMAVRDREVASLRAERSAVDDSWLIDTARLDQKRIGEVVAEGADLGVKIELRGRRA